MSSPTVKNMTSEGFEDHFRCCICLDVYIDPASVPCGHNFCLDCIEGFWDTKETPECPLCKQTFKPRPKLKVNQEFSSIIEFFKRQKEDAAPQSHQVTDVTPFASGLCRNHNKPLTMFCRQDCIPVCIKCTEGDHKHHKVVPMEKQKRRIKTKQRQTKADIAQMIQSRKEKIAEIKNSLDDGKKSTEREIKRSQQVCLMLKSAIDTQQAVLVQELEDRQKEAERTAEELEEELKREINQLQARSSELQHMELSHNPLDVLQNVQSVRGLPPTREWSEVRVHSDNCLGSVRRGFAKLSDIMQEVLNRLSVEEVEKMRQHEVSVTVDPDTASGWLVVSPDGKKVSCQKKKAPRPDTPKRFDPCVCVLAKQSFKSGRSCWIVQVGDKPDWDLGVALGSVDRKGSIVLRPDNGYWAIYRRKGGSLSACAGSTVTLHLASVPQKVGVFLDYEEGLVSFFNAEAGTHIYTFSGCSFPEPLYPYFNPCVQGDGRNVAPLRICSLEAGVRDERRILI